MGLAGSDDMTNHACMHACIHLVIAMLHSSAWNATFELLQLAATEKLAQQK